MQLSGSLAPGFPLTKIFARGEADARLAIWWTIVAKLGGGGVQTPLATGLLCTLLSED